MELAKVRGENTHCRRFAITTPASSFALRARNIPTSRHTPPEIAWRMNKKYHAGLIVVSPDAQRVRSLLDNYAQRFADDFLTRATPMETGRQA